MKPFLMANENFPAPSVAEMRASERGISALWFAPLNALVFVMSCI
jgi:hypothetical protein